MDVYKGKIKFLDMDYDVDSLEAVFGSSFYKAFPYDDEEWEYANPELDIVIEYDVDIDYGPDPDSRKGTPYLLFFRCTLSHNGIEVVIDDKGKIRSLVEQLGLGLMPEYYDPEYGNDYIPDEDY